MTQLIPTSHQNILFGKWNENGFRTGPFRARKKDCIRHEVNLLCPYHQRALLSKVNMLTSKENVLFFQREHTSIDVHTYILIY